MTLAEIEESVLQALDEGHEPTIEAYAEFAAGHIDMGAMAEELCLAVIHCDPLSFQSVMAAFLFVAPDIGEALAKIERHIEAQRKPFAAAQASGIDDQSEHNRHLLADLERELNAGRD
jgi:hypothetical protein